MKYLIVFLLLVSLVFSKPVLLVVDASGSMNDQASDNQTKIAAAKSAAKNFIDNSADNELAVMQFSYCGDTRSAADPFSGDIKVIQRFTSDKNSLKNSVNNIKAKGDTPIEGAILEAIDYFKRENKQNGVIILLTDGEETCGGNPKQAAQEAYENGYAVINVIAYNISGGSLEQARAIATAGGGKVYTAQNQIELERALTDASGTSSCCLPAFLLLALSGISILKQKFE